jgi:hypothetical protein
MLGGSCGAVALVRIWAASPVNPVMETRIGFSFPGPVNFSTLMALSCEWTEAHSNTPRASKLTRSQHTSRIPEQFLISTVALAR